MKYKGWGIEAIETVQIGHKLPNTRSLKQQLGINTRRKIKGYLITHPDEGKINTVFDSLKHAKTYIDNY